MDLADLESLMAEVGLGISAARGEAGIADRHGRREAYLRLTSLSDSDSFATVWVSVGGGYEIEVAGGFITGLVDDLSLEYGDVREYVESYARAATVYLEGKWSIHRSRVFRVPILTIQNDVARLNLAPRRHWSTNWGAQF